MIYPSDCAEYVLKGSEITGRVVEIIENHTNLEFVVLQGSFFLYSCF